jgi:hypothetical protein
MKNIAIILSILALAGCTNKFKQKVGITTTGPNEYRVEKNKSLDFPPHYELPAPGTLKE